MISKLTILWTSRDKDTALNMILMYALKANTNKWWDHCKLICWGPSNLLLAEDTEVQEAVQAVMAAGVKVYACRRCAEKYGLVDRLEAMGIMVQLMGEPLTGDLKDETCRLITL